MARCVVGVSSGTWYFECRIRREEGHYRVGWAQKKAELRAAVGFDKWGFGYRDIRGAVVHDSKRLDDMCAPYGANDVVGCSIDVDAGEIGFYKNGETQGVAFRSVPAGTYYPAVSLYGNAQITANFGPTFDFPPEKDHKPISDLASRVRPPVETRASKRHRVI
ncbi:hypothetical protein CTAYLR_001722 [Chrysophaeum taylorii]|uniref:B30.2/SPRY domain-containing protein n=1 Tax=Chrysophaeum taylorii TaxID=2483200 RepID=A0AAD7XET7_9STRA|nr:hypothetical protein CTAYLR_001722 [Chrysophaeum taylorii]